jgi:hypothetical protein
MCAQPDLCNTVRPGTIRALVRADIGRYKRVIGDTAASRTDARQAMDVVVAVRALNRMLELGAPNLRVA